MDKYLYTIAEIPDKFKKSYERLTKTSLQRAYIVIKAKSRVQAELVCRFVGLNIQFHSEYSFVSYDEEEHLLCNEDSNGISIASYNGRLNKGIFVTLDNLLNK